MVKVLSTRCLSLSSESEGVSSLPGGVGGATDGVGVLVTLADTSGVLASGGEASHFAVLVDALGDPLELGVVADGVVVGVDENDFEVLVGGVFTNPVRVHDSERATVSADTLFGDGLESSGELDEDTHVGGLTHGGSLGNWLLSSTSADLDSVNDEALSGLVSESSGLFRSSWLGSSVDGVQVSVLPDTNSLQVSHSVRGLLAPNFIHVLVCAHFRSNLLDNRNRPTVTLYSNPSQKI